MSDTSQGPGWWQASDGKWYSPEQTPGPLPGASAFPDQIAPGQTVPTTIPASGPNLPPTLPDGGNQNGFDTGGSPSGPWYPSGTTPGSGPAPTSPDYGQAVGYGPAPTSPGYGQAAGYGPAPAAPGYGPPPSPGYGYGPPPGASGYGYQPGYSPYGFVPPAKTNTLAVVSLICSLLWIFGLGGVLAVIFGFVARSQIKRSDDGQRGSGLALAGIIIGFAGIALMVLFVTIGIVVDHHCRQNGTCTFTTLNTQN